MSRYFQQIAVTEIGSAGQKKIAAASVLIIGAGGLGTPVAAYLSSSGIGKIGIVDGDAVAISNLQRQFHYNPEDKGQNKAELLQQRIQKQNPENTVIAYPFFINENNCKEIIAQYNIICDCTDNSDSRLNIDSVCSALNKPLVYAAVRDWEGYLTVLNYKNKIQLTDIFSIEELKNQALNNCNVSGIVSTTCGAVGSLQAAEVIKIIIGAEEVLDGEILCINSLMNIFRKLKIKSSRFS